MQRNNNYLRAEGTLKVQDRALRARACYVCPPRYNKRHCLKCLKHQNGAVSPKPA